MGARQLGTLWIAVGIEEKVNNWVGVENGSIYI